MASGPDSMDAHDLVCNILFFVSVLVLQCDPLC